MVKKMKTKYFLQKQTLFLSSKDKGFLVLYLKQIGPSKINSVSDDVIKTHFSFYCWKGFFFYVVERKLGYFF